MISLLISGLLAVEAVASTPPATPPPVPTLCDCVAKKRCWNLVLAAFGQISSLEKTEMEASFPGQYFPGTRANALRRSDESGHFLRVTCGAQQIPCTGYRDALEKRLAVSSFLRSSPLHAPEKDLFDPKTLEITSLGDEVMDEALRCRPQLWSELAPMLLAAGTSGN